MNNPLTSRVNADHLEKDYTPRWAAPAKPRTRDRWFRSITDWLSPVESPSKSDLIFVLAGRWNRKTYALQLYNGAYAPRILFSVGRFEIRRFECGNLPSPVNLLDAASRVAPPKRHYFVCFEGRDVRVERIPVFRFGTFTEIKALREWLRQRPDIRTVQVVSSREHLPRARMCCSALLPQSLKIRFVATPTRVESGQESWPSQKDGAWQILSEAGKILIYRFVLWRAVSP